MTLENLNIIQKESNLQDEIKNLSDIEDNNMEEKVILILGGDGYLGWPTAMYLSKKGYKIIVADNYSRRNISRELNREQLFKNINLKERCNIWNEENNNKIECEIGDCTDYFFMMKLITLYRPYAVVHYAEQPSAPYSMIGRKEAQFTLYNNTTSTLNLIQSIIQSNGNDMPHIIKLGTMGEYGTPEIDIEEGWLNVEHKGRKHKFLFPKIPGSLYHATKVMDSDMLNFYSRNNGIKVTDIHQGPVYGINTKESEKNEKLWLNFNYDDIFGTVLNRFIVQAVVGIPLTVYGEGGQTRGYININDTVRCIELAIENPPADNEPFKIFNQITELFSVNELADNIKRVGDKLGLNVNIESIDNPRKEKEKHYYNPVYTNLKDLGLEPNLLTDNIIEDMLNFVIKHKEKINKNIIMPKVRWV